MMNVSSGARAVGRIGIVKLLPRQFELFGSVSSEDTARDAS